jgi:DNA-binding transcriptional MerR regulator
MHLLLRPNSVARRLGVSAARVRQMDDVLRPLRTEDGARLYRADDVERVAGMRDAARSRP